MSIDAKDVLVRWKVDPTEGVDGVRKLAKEIRDEQKIERDLASIRAELEKQTSGMSRAFGDMGNSIRNMGLNQAVQLFGSLKNAIVDAFSESQKWVRAFGDGTRNVDAMSKACAYLIDDLELLKTKTRLTTGDLSASAVQLDAVAKAAVVMARQLKISKDDALNQLTDALVGGKGLEKALRQVGIETNLTGDHLTQMNDAMNQLVNRFGDASIEAKNFSEKLSQAKNKLGDTVGEMMKAIQQHPLMKQMLSDLTEGFTTTAAAVKLATTNSEAFWKVMNPNWSAASIIKGNQFSDQINAAISGIRKAQGDAAKKVASMPPAAAATKEIIGTTLTFNTKRRSRGQGPAQGIGWFERGFEEVGGVIDEEQKREANEREKYASSLGEVQRQIREDAAARKRKDAADELTKALNEQAEAQQKLLDLQYKTDKEVWDVGVGALQGFAGGLWEIADAALTSGENFGWAMAKMVKATLLGVAQQATVKAIFETAEGIAASARLDFAAASLHFGAAATFGVIAATSGAVGLVLGAAGVGRSNETSRSERTSAARSASSDAPKYGQQITDNRPININLYLGDANNPSSALVMTQQLYAKMGSYGRN